MSTPFRSRVTSWALPIVSQYQAEAHRRSLCAQKAFFIYVRPAFFWPDFLQPLFLNTCFLRCLFPVSRLSYSNFAGDIGMEKSDRGPELSVN